LRVSILISAVALPILPMYLASYTPFTLRLTVWCETINPYFFVGSLVPLVFLSLPAFERAPSFFSHFAAL